MPMHTGRTVVRVGAVSFTNTLPLIHGLGAVTPLGPKGPADPTGGARPETVLELSVDPPAQLAARMHAGRVDVGLIPVVEHFRAGVYATAGEIGICSRGPVDSVRLWCRRPAAEVTHFAADTRSRTSVALAQVWFAKNFGRTVRPSSHVEPVAARCRPDVDGADAVLVIGDLNWYVPAEGWAEVVDLGRAWHDLTGLGFVYARWSVRPELSADVVSEVADRLTRAKQDGVAAAPDIARRVADGSAVDPARVHRYLTSHLRYDIGEPEARGMELFRTWCGELGLLEPARISQPRREGSAVFAPVPADELPTQLPPDRIAGARAGPVASMKYDG